MKKLFFIAFLMTATLSFGQEETEEEVTPDVAQNELSLDVLDLLAFGVLDISYEYLLNDYSSLSIEVFNKLFNKNDGEEVDLSQPYSKNFSLTGKFKYFLEDKPNTSGFYAQGFLIFSHGKHGHDVELPDPETGKITTREVPIEFSDLALGFGGGYKLVSKQGFFADAGAGVGRNLFHEYSPNFVFHSNISVGFRF